MLTRVLMTILRDVGASNARFRRCTGAVASLLFAWLSLYKAHHTAVKLIVGDTVQFSSYTLMSRLRTVMISVPTNHQPEVAGLSEPFLFRGVEVHSSDSRRHGDESAGPWPPLHFFSRGSGDRQRMWLA